jgi:outer membrane protein OmpA-like peptidoglycan-associated protein
MGRRGAIYAVALTLGCGAASSTPPTPVPTAPSVAAHLPVTTASTAAPAVLSAPSPPGPPPPKPVWTTPEKSNLCAEYARASLYSPSYDTREACEKWVKERSCQPGFSCFDGCNWRTCTSHGDGMIGTLLGCSFGLAVELEFQADTTKLSPEPDWTTLLTGVQRVLRAPERTMIVLGYAEANEAGGNAAAQQQLALQRARVVVKALLKRGIAANRMVAKVGERAALPRRDDAFAWRRVRIELDPAERVRNDFESSSPEYQDFCGAKSRRGE